MRQHASFRWALLVGTVFWLSVTASSIAHAIPIDYEIVPGGGLSGTFTLDVAAPLAPFSAWHLVPSIGPVFDAASLVLDNVSIDPTDHRLFLLDNHGPLFTNIDLVFSSNTLTWQGGIGDQSGRNDLLSGVYRVASSAAPEPLSSVLLAIGLLVLAGSRWLSRRGERQQLG